MPPPQTNCTILEVQAPGSTDEWKDSEASPGADLWTAAAGGGRAYYKERRRELRREPTTTWIVERTLIVGLGDPEVAWGREQHVVFLVDGDDAPSTGTVQDIASARLVGIPPGLQTTRLTLEPL